jgi:FixJ family two-component response regulator
VIDASAELPDSADVSDINMMSAEHNEELESRLHDAIGKLPERCRAVFALSRFEDLSHKEIAERLGISVRNDRKPDYQSDEIAARIASRHHLTGSRIVVRWQINQVRSW